MNTIIPERNNVWRTIDWYKKRDSYRPVTDENYIPTPGDLIFFQSRRTGTDYNVDGIETGGHVGIVAGYEDGIIYTIEGNTQDNTWSGPDGVNQHTFKRYHDYVLGFGINN